MSDVTDLRPSNQWLDDAGDRLVEEMPSHFERLRWTAGRIRRHRTEALRELLAGAVHGSPFHRRRLAGVDPATVTVEDLPDLPVMTKAEMMAEFDEVVVDERLTLAAVNAHLARQGSEPTLLFDRYLAITSGGSSGHRGVFVYDHHDVVPYMSCVVRGGMSRVASMVGWPPPQRIPVAVVAAPSAVHATGAFSHLLRAVSNITFAPATLPIDEIVELVDRAQPVLLVGYTSTIAQLADARLDGRLGIEPRMVLVTSEQLTDELQHRIVAGFGAPPTNSFASSEGLIGAAPPGSDEFTFASDAAIVEFVDPDDQPVPVGATADHVLVTVLTNRVQPLIRYRLDDRMTPLPPAADHGHQRARVDGRHEVTLTVGGVELHALTLRSALVRNASIDEYQVRYRTDAVDVDIVSGGSVDVEAVRSDVAGAIADAGATASVLVRVVPSIARDDRTGKALRFVDDRR